MELEACYYLNDYAKILLKKFPKALDNYAKLKTEEDRASKAYDHMREFFLKNSRVIEKMGFREDIYRIQRQLCIHSKSFFTRNIALELLSTPTHTPCWIDPAILINRISIYEKENESIDKFDFQIAMGRIPFNEMPIALEAQLDKISNPEIKEIFQYHFGLLKIEACKIDRPDLWIQSIICLLYTSPSPRDQRGSRMPSSA